MSDRLISAETSLREPDAGPAPYRHAPATPPAPKPDCDWISCGSCGRTFSTVDGPGMIAAIKGPCPDCGGTFELVEALSPRRKDPHSPPPAS